MPFAVVFPGQGAATPGAGRPWTDHPAWEVVLEAERATGRDLARLLLDADASELGTTRASQLAVLLTSLVAWRALATDLQAAPGLGTGSESVTPVAFAGHSLGQITALIAAGALSPDDGYRLAAVRAEASQASADRRRGRMAALVGATPEQAADACTASSEAWIANVNAPGQVVIAGTADGVDATVARAKEIGVRRAIPLAVGHAFHTPLLADAAEQFRPALAATAFVDTSAPVVANTDARPHTVGADWPDHLARHLTEPVRWVDSQLALVGLGATTFVEAGPGAALAGMAKRTVPDVAVVNVATPDDLPAALERLSGPVLEEVAP